MAALRFLPLLLLIAGCALERPVEKVLPESSRIARKDLEGTFVFLKSVVEIKSPGKTYQGYAPGLHLESDKLVQFQLHENQLDVTSIDPLYAEENAAPQSQIVASFPARYVDVVRKKNGDGDPTHEEEESETRRIWKERDFARVELVNDLADPMQLESRATALVAGLEVDPARGALSFAIERLLRDGSSIRIRYSFLRYRPSASYVQRPYSIEEQVQFGYFRTTTYRLDGFDQFTESLRRDYMDRWDTTKTIVFYFSAGFPEHLKPIVRRAFSEWSQTLKSAVGDSVLELRENTGQQLGDLRYNLIAYDDSEHSTHGVLGYAPSVTNPRTGEILKADVILYGRVLKRALFQESFWERSRHIPSAPPPEPIPTPVAPSGHGPGGGSVLDLPVASLREHILEDLRARITPISEPVVQQAMQASRAVISREELEKRVFAGVFAHEFGHALGLRHNFMGSADEGHFGKADRSSSVMDYGFLQGRRAEIGPYDRAAILYAYSPDGGNRSHLLKSGFYFCSDEEVYSSRAPLCQLYDSGSNLRELVANQVDRYFSSYDVNNLRLERVDFAADSERYERRVLSLLLPIRLVYDNALAILQAHARKNYTELWILARQRVEAGEKTRPEDMVAVEVPSGTALATGDNGPRSVDLKMTRTLDRRRIQAVADDARHAKQDAVSALRRVVLDTSRPDFDRMDGITHRIQVRGILSDRIAALSLISAPTEHPLLSGRLISPYSLVEKVVPALFASLLSNTSEVQDPEGGEETYYRIRQHDIALRTHALRLLSEQIAKVGRQPEARELIRLDALYLNDRSFSQRADWEKFQNTRVEFREFYRTLMLEEVLRNKKVLAGETEFSFAELSSYEQGRNTFDFAYTQVGEQMLLSAPIAVVEGLKTASGLLIRNNLNVAQDYLYALDKTCDQLHEEIFKGTGAINHVLAMTELDKRREALRRYVTGEQLFLQEMRQAFTQEK